VKRLLLITAAALLLASGPAFAQATIATGPHDFSAGTALRNANANVDGQTCVFCHTPHSGNLTGPLWNRASTTTAYQVYTSSTMDAAAPTAAAIQSSVSGACLSCHDGSIAIDVLANAPNAGTNNAAFVAFTVQGTAKGTYGSSAPGSNNIMTGGTAFMGSDLRNDHPITIIYETARAATPTEFITQAVVGTKITVGPGPAAGTLPLFGAAGATATVECASCHNPHNNSLGAFLRKANTGSNLCLTCHIK
jgi:predicted CXXCH cytochrome family protein